VTVIISDFVLALAHKRHRARALLRAAVAFENLAPEFGPLAGCRKPGLLSVGRVAIPIIAASQPYGVPRPVSALRSCLRFKIWSAETCLRLRIFWINPFSARRPKFLKRRQVSALQIHMNQIWKHWAQQLYDGDAAVRAQAAEQLCRLGPQAAAAAVPLLHAVGDGDERVYEWANAALESLGPPPDEDLEAIADLLGHESPDIGYWAAALLGRLGTSASQAVGALGQALASGRSLAVRQQSAWALGQIGAAARESLPTLQACADGPDPRLRRLSRAAIELISETPS
jgi:hypothetical protein